MPGAFDPNTSLGSTKDTTIRMEQSTSRPDAQSSTGVPGYDVSEELAWVKLANNGLCEDNNGLQTEMREICALLGDLLQQQRPVAPDVVEEPTAQEITNSTKRPARPNAAHSDASQHVPPIFTSTPAMGA